MTATLTFNLGSIEYVEVEVTADVSLAAQTVAVSLDGGTTWLASTWQGSAGLVRNARTNSPVTFSTKVTRRVLVKVTDNPEVPIITAGRYQVVSL